MVARQVNPFLIDIFPETVIVGGNPSCLFDASDATYVEAVSPAALGSSVQVQFSAVTITSISAIPLYVRAMYRLNSGAPPAVVGMTINASDVNTGEAFGFFTSNVAYGFEFAATDVVYDITSWSWNEDHAGATADFVTALGIGDGWLTFDSRTHDLSDAGLRIIECYLLGDLTALAPPLRRYPPVNNGGFGPTRHWPRTVNRRAGGTY